MKKVRKKWKNEKKVKRKLIDDGINDVKKIKLNLETCVETLNKDANKLSLEVEHKKWHWQKANSFRKIATGKAVSASVLDETAVKL